MAIIVLGQMTYGGEIIDISNAQRAESIRKFVSDDLSILLDLGDPRGVQPNDLDIQR